MKNNTFTAAVDQYAAPMKFKNEAAFTKAGGDASRLTDKTPAAPTPAAPAAKPTPAAKPAPTSAPTKPAAPSPMFGLSEEQKRLNKPDPAQRKAVDARAAENAKKPSFREAVSVAGKGEGPLLSEQMQQTADELEADEAEAAWDALPEHQSNLDDDREFEKMQSKGESPEGLPLHQTDVNDPINQHLQSVGVFDASPGQIMQFAEMLGIPAAGSVNSPRLLASAISQHGVGDALLQIMEKHGLQPRPVAPPRVIPPVAGSTGQQEVQPMPQKSGSEKAGSMAGDFVSGFIDKSPIGKGGRLASRLARKVTGNRFSAAAALYAAEYEPMPMNLPDFVQKDKSVIEAQEKHAAGAWDGNVDKNGNAIVFVGFVPYTVTNAIPPLPAEDDDDLDYWMDSPEESAPPMESQEPTYGEKEVAKIKSGITMPTGEIDNEDAKGGDQLGLFGGTGKKKVVGTKYKQDKPQGNAKQDVMFERMDDDPDQQTLFSTFGEATARYQAGLKKK